MSVPGAFSIARRSPRQPVLARYHQAAKVFTLIDAGVAATAGSTVIRTWKNWMAEATRIGEPALRSPRVFACLVMTFYLLSALPLLARAHFDLSVFIVAGDQFVNPAQLASPIIVKDHSAGYDGQFYYRIALAPLHLQQADAFGVHFDSAPWRVQRILYPVLSWGVALGRPAFVPASLFLVNLAGIAIIGFAAVRLTSRLSLPAYTSLAIALWPGLIFSLTHDTTEIVAAAFLLAAVEAYFAQKLVLFAALIGLAALARETSVLFIGGVFCFELMDAIRRRTKVGRWHRPIIVMLAFLPFLLWRELQFVIFDQAPPAADIKHNLDWPFVGFVETIGDGLLGQGPYGKMLISRVYLLGTVALLATFCAAVAVRVPRLLPSRRGVLAAGWLPIMALMVLLSADPWTAYFRAFTECDIIGCLILACRPPSRSACQILFAGCLLAWVGAWAISAHAVW
jgi:hypothetical protein